MKFIAHELHHQLAIKEKWFIFGTSVVAHNKMNGYIIIVSIIIFLIHGSEAL